MSGAYSESFEYNEIGNIVTKNSVSYTYGSKPHAVTSVGATGYTYDENGNMTVRGSDNITWDAENRPVTVSYNGTSSTFVYDGDGTRVKKTENGETILYVNKYYEKNLTTGEETSYYYLGNRLVAKHSNTTLNYIHQDHLTGTSLVTSENGAQLGGTKYYPFGECRNSTGDLGTDKLFTGQRLDDTGLYYYGARYYDASIGRFISPDPIVQWSERMDFVSSSLSVNIIPLGLGSLSSLQVLHPRLIKGAPTSSQMLNRYSYVLNNPLRFTDPTGYRINWGLVAVGVALVAVGVASVGLGAFVAGAIITAEVATTTSLFVVFAGTCDALFLGGSIAAFGGILAPIGGVLTYKGFTSPDDSEDPELPIESDPKSLTTDTTQPTTQQTASDATAQSESATQSGTATNAIMSPNTNSGGMTLDQATQDYYSGIIEYQTYLSVYDANYGTNFASTVSK
ncbi:MAG: RHS repeat-associated core domain-containing protein [Dehalococcoidales bacterium]